MEYLDKDAKLTREKELLGRWDWLTEGLGYNEKLDTSIILENSYNKMIQEGQLPRGWLEQNVLEEDVLTEAPMTSSAVGSNVLPKIMFPIIRRVFPELIANKIVSVQPLTQPTGIIYYILYQYSNTKGNITAADEYSANAQQTSPAYAVFYSSEKIGPFEVTMGAGNTAVATGTQVVNFLGTNTAEFSLKRIEVYNKSTMTAIPTVLSSDMSTDNTFTGTGANVQYTADDGSIYLKSGLATNGTELVVYLVYDQEGSKKIPEMEFSISSMSVSTTERKMKVRWTKESEQDMQAYHKIDVESELVKVASMQMNYEIDREIITFISDRVIPALSFIHDWTNDAAGSGNNTSGNYLDRHRALAQKIYMAQAKIAQYNRLGAATWAVTSPQVAAVLQMLPDWKGEINGVGATITNSGLLGGKLQVFVDPNRYGASANEILLGYKSEQTVYGAGVVYSPYTSWMSNVITHPENFDSIRGFFSRYALTMVTRGQYNYAKLNLLNYGV